MRRRIAIMTGGGDCPGLNVAIRTITRVAVHSYGCEVVGILDGYAGLIEGRYRRLQPADVRGILRIGGTILGASNRTNPFAWRRDDHAPPIDASEIVCRQIEDLAIDALIVIGGDGSLTLASRFVDRGVPIVGIPKTIDNDVYGTDYAIGFDSCVATVIDALDRLHTTAESHHRVMLVEVMGRTTGWVALHAGVAGGADVILMPEIPYTVDGILDAIERRRAAGSLFTIAVVGEGISTPGGTLVYQSRHGEAHDWRLGGVCNALAAELAELTDREVRSIVLGHLQRGGSPTAFDRVLATTLAHRAVQAALDGTVGVAVGLDGDETRLIPLRDIAVGPRPVPPSHSLVDAARRMGIYVG